jgi:hypothetical protein
MEAARARHTFDGLHVLAFALETEQEAGKDGFSIDEHGACPAFAELAAMLGACQLKVFPQNFQQSLMRREGRVDGLAVDPEFDQLSICLRLGFLQSSSHNKII